MKIIKIAQPKPLKANPQQIQQQKQQTQPGSVQAQQPQPVQQQQQQQNQPQQTQQQGQSPNLAPEENTALTQIINHLKKTTPELGNIMQNPRSKAIVFNVLDAIGNLNPGNIKTILKKIESV